MHPALLFGSFSAQESELLTELRETLTHLDPRALDKKLQAEKDDLISTTTRIIQTYKKELADVTAELDGVRRLLAEATDQKSSQRAAESTEKKQLKRLLADEQSITVSQNEAITQLKKEREMLKNGVINSEANARSIAHELVQLSHLAPITDGLQAYIDSNFKKLRAIGLDGDVSLFANESLRQLREYEAGYLDRLVKRVVEQRVGELKRQVHDTTHMRQAKFMTPEAYQEHLKSHHMASDAM